jgi:SAM-dependent methyltransferase
VVLAVANPGGTGRTVARLREPVSRRMRAAAFRRRWGFPPPPDWSDWVGYEVLLEEIERHRLDLIEGDVLEIGCLLGGGTAKLCGWFAREADSKRVVTVDVFDPEFDPTATIEGWTMRELYAKAIQKKSQRAIFDGVTRGCDNLVVVVGDSTKVPIPTDRLAFAFVDGSHVPEDVRIDFETVWSRLAPGAVAAFHDYGGDLPGVTGALHACIATHAEEIARLWTRTPALLFVQRAG